MTTWETVTPLVDDEQQRAFWEPWQPNIGDRVRVRLSGECRVAPPHPLSYHADWGAGHPPEFDGQPGTVVPAEEACCQLKTEGHPYLVKFDTDVRVSTSRPLIIGADFAACELEREP